MRWRHWLIEWPAALVDLWFAAYRLLILVLTIITVTGVVLMLVLAAFGIRWGW
jgi:hypothetical protein